jgi:hypothetical protein
MHDPGLKRPERFLFFEWIFWLYDAWLHSTKPLRQAR